MTELALTVAIVTLAYVAYRLHVLSQETRELRDRLAQQESVLRSVLGRVWTLESASRPEPTPVPEGVAGVASRTPLADARGSQPAILSRDREGAVLPEKPRRDWEALIGANWLNRLGALVLVIGIALFLGYSLTQLGPAGKIAIGLLIGASLLGGGMALARRPLYQSYSYSLMGAGWAVLYFATYAMHGLPAARVIENAGVGVLLLIAVSAAMIGHALLYRSELATALAYLLAFAGLNVSPLTEFAVVATLLLAISLIALAHRFQWFRLPLMGVVLTYLTFVLRYDPSIYGRAGLLNGQATLWIYWGAFEAFDLLRLRSGTRQPLLFSLNVCGFVGASLLHEWNMKAEDWSVFLALSALAYLASAVLRAQWTPREESDRAQGYEPAAIAASGLMAGALVERFTGTGITLALLLEGEMVVLAARALGNRWLERAGAVLLALPLFRLLAVDAPGATAISFAGLTVKRWTPVGLLMSAVFIMNRVLMPRAWYFAAAAGVVLLAIANTDLPRLVTAPVIAVAGALLLLSRDADARWAGIGALVFAFGRAAIVNTGDGDLIGTGVVVAALYAGHFITGERLIRPALSILATGLLTLLIYEKVQGRLLTVSLGIQGAALLAAGFLLSARIFRVSGLLLFLLCIAKLFIYDLRELDTVSRILSFVVLGVMLMAASWVYTRFRDKLSRLL